MEAIWNIMNGWYSRVDEAPWERRKERRLGTEMGGKFITELESDSGNKGEIPEGERWKTAEDSVSSERSGNADVLCRKENFVHRPAAALSCWVPTEEWDNMGNVREKWGWRERDQDQRILTCSQGLCQTVNFDSIRLLHSILWFLPFHNPMAVLSPPLPQVTVS